MKTPFAFSLLAALLLTDLPWLHAAATNDAPAASQDAAIDVLAVAIGTVAPAQKLDPTTIGVLNIAGPRRTLANNIVALLEANLSSDPHFAMVERSALDKVLEEQALGKSGIITPETAARIGQITGAKILVTGREFSIGSRDDIVVVTSIIGTETGRVFSKTAQGSATNLVALVANVSEKIKQTIGEQTTNLIATTADSPEQRLDKVVQELKGKTKPSVHVQINGTAPDSTGQIAQTEMERVFQKAGFALVDDKSHTSADIVVTGDAVAVSEIRERNLFSGRATLGIKVQENSTGKILTLDVQHGIAVDIAKQAAADMALKNAAECLSERILPLLAK